MAPEREGKVGRGRRALRSISFPLGRARVASAAAPSRGCSLGCLQEEEKADIIDPSFVRSFAMGSFRSIRHTTNQSSQPAGRARRIRIQARVRGT